MSDDPYWEGYTRGMMGLPPIRDYSAYLTPERLAVEELAWLQSGMFQFYAGDLLKVMTLERCDEVVEIGCGVGLVPQCLPGFVGYLGIDANPGCIERALDSNGSDHSFREFRCEDIRTAIVAPFADDEIVCAFAFLKHFALHEWPDIVRRVLAFGRVGVFTMNVGTEDVDDFSQGYPHTWVTPATLDNAVQAAGHGVVSMTLIHTGETMVWTRAT